MRISVIALDLVLVITESHEKRRPKPIYVNFLVLLRMKILMTILMNFMTT